MKEIMLKLRIEVDPEADPVPSTDDVIKAVNELLTVGWKEPVASPLVFAT
jgi:hypothetical protein